MLSNSKTLQSTLKSLIPSALTSSKADTNLEEADYVIVGGGLTGCAIASRLSQDDPNLQVVLVEAGIDASDDPLTKDIGGAFSLAGSDLDYNYKTTPQANTDDRVHTATAGKVLGGGSILNYGLWLRGDARDYDQWAKLVGDERWSYKGLLPYFRKSENHFKAKQAPEHRGSDGPIRITSVFESDPKRRYGLREPIKAAWEEMGLQKNPHGDCGSLQGICESLENWDDGKRQPSNLAYSLKNVRVLTSAVVHKVSMVDDSDGKLRASNVVLADGRQIKARKEIILSAGTIKTPQILMLSGIGPAALLASQGIPLVKDNAEVGNNYFDHFALFQVWKLRNPEKGLSTGGLGWDDPALFKGLPFDWTVNEGTPSDLLMSAMQSDAANGKMNDQSLMDPAKSFVETMVFYSPVGAPVPVDGSYIATSTMLLAPTSRGSLQIVSSSPKDPPVIDPNFYDTEIDRTALIHGVRRILRALLKTASGKQYVEREEAPEGMPSLSADSPDADIDARIRKAGVSHAHAAGTAAMGKVVDTRLRVHGIAGLRIADASILPIAIGGHPQATLYGLAEQAAEMILQDK
ncbi:MAG: hypothetical protein L6R42_000909 [Xanthoria sp. 1 TBL-2021]|nr:MAG: hypothetical protein L6R42_000909 [Xanthoria sp. 1 TBL-2021]